MPDSLCPLDPTFRNLCSMYIYRVDEVRAHATLACVACVGIDQIATMQWLLAIVNCHSSGWRMHFRRGDAQLMPRMESLVDAVCLQRAISTLLCWG